MAQHYEVPAGETLVIRGPANIIVKTGDVPMVGNAGENVEPPVLASIDPETAAITDPEFTLTAIGSDFEDVSIVALNGTDAATTFIDATTLTAQVDPALFAAGDVAVTVRTGPSVSAASTLTLTESEAHGREEKGKNGKKGKKAEAAG
jgi:hypothetical protein